MDRLGEWELQGGEKTWEPYRGVVEKCSGGLRFKLDSDVIAKAEEVLEKGIRDEFRYDMKVALVELPTGGYNIVVHNRRERTDVRGLCDPSFVAFHVASYTAKINWRSNNLHIWLDPCEGWGLSTRASRTSLQAGRDRSALGALGVVNVRGFRTWLEKEFFPLIPHQGDNFPAAGNLPKSEGTSQDEVNRRPIGFRSVPPKRVSELLLFPFPTLHRIPAALPLAKNLAPLG